MTTYIQLYYRYRREGYTHEEAASKAEWWVLLGVAVRGGNAENQSP